MTAEEIFGSNIGSIKLNTTRRSSPAVMVMQVGIPQ